jgi:hypothetical protein
MPIRRVLLRALFVEDEYWYLETGDADDDFSEIQTAMSLRKHPESKDDLIFSCYYCVEGAFIEGKIIEVDEKFLKSTMLEAIYIGIRDSRTDKVQRHILPNVRQCSSLQDFLMKVFPDIIASEITSFVLPNVTTFLPCKQKICQCEHIGSSEKTRTTQVRPQDSWDD